MKSKNKGITLIALVITIILLLILAGITIVQLTENGLFEKTILAEEKYKNAQQDEKNKLEDYSNQIDFLSSRDLAIAEKIMKPNTWSTTDEENFGDGLYGRRFIGKITARANSSYELEILDTDKISIISSGGWFKDVLAIRTIGNSASWYWACITAQQGHTIFASLTDQTRTDSDYDIWILYTKI